MTEVREVNITVGSLTAANLSNQYFGTAGSVGAVNGRILKVVLDYNSTGTGGSIWLGISGAVTEEFWRSNAFAADVVAYPRVIPVDATNVSLSGTAPFAVERLCNAPLYVAGSTLGNGSVLGNITVFYEQD